jgi:hypothetical protein
MSGARESSALSAVLAVATAGALIREARADEPEPLDEEFLDYLMQLEGDEEDWTLFDSQEAEPPAAKSATARPAPIQEPVAKSTHSPPSPSPSAQNPPSPSPSTGPPRTEVKR